MKQSIFNFDSGSGVFFTSDTHFGHESIINFCNRPFSSVKEMDQALIDNWNSVVGPNDYVFHLGDFCFKGTQYWDNILNQLNGHKFLILGNHDLKNLNAGPMLKFDWVGFQAYIQIENRSIFLNHFPFLCYGGSYRSPENVIYALHGHTHLNKNNFNGRDIPRLNMCFSSQLDVGVDAHNFTPIPWEKVDILIKEQIEHKQNQLQTFEKYLKYAENNEAL